MPIASRFGGNSLRAFGQRGAIGVPRDAFFNYVSMLLSTTSLANATNNLFVDSSGAFTPVRRIGNISQGSFSPYGSNWSNYFDGSGDYLTAPANAAWAFGTGDFTVECWVYFVSGSVGGRITNRLSGGGANGTWGFNISPTTFTFTEVVAGEPGVTATGLPTMTSTWTHLAACRSGSTLRLFANGVLVGSGTNTTNFNNTSYVLGIGAAYETSITGYMSNVRIVKGTAVYTSNFTPSTTPLTAISGTSLLTCQSNRFRDISTNNFAITPNGDARVTDFGPFSPLTNIAYNQSDITNWSGYFDGSGDYLNTAASSSLGLTGDWTVEGWLYQTSTAGAQIFLDTRGSGATGFGIYCSLTGYAGGPGAFGYATNSALVATSSTVIPLNTWAHLAVTRSGNTITGYINGVSAFTYTESRTLSSTMSYFIGADYLAGSNAYGYFSNLRVVRGTAVYTGNFTPPTSPLTAISGTSLLTCQNAAFTDNSTNNFVVTINGNTTVTGNSPFNTVGYWSNYFTASDYLQIAGPATGTGTWTVEGWFYFTSFPGGPLFAQGTADNAASWFLYLTSSGGLNFYSNGNISASAGGVVTANTWVHIALVSNASNSTTYVNGTSVATGSYAGKTFNGSPFQINRGYGGATSGNPGYQSNVRMVVGTAVYTSNFTPPTSPLTAISGTSLLTCQNGRFIDNSTNAYAVTATGSPSVQSFDPFYTSTIASNGGSLYSEDGSGDYLRTALSPAFGFGTSDFTFECWLYPISYPNDSYMVSTGSSPTNNSVSLEIRNAQVACHLFISGSHSDVQFTDLAPRLRAWNHLAISRVNGVLYGFLNGVRSSVTQSLTADFGDSALLGVAESAYIGYVADVCTTKGTAVYSSSTYTVPTAPLTPTPATTFLLNSMNAGIYDATGINTIETVGSTQVSTSVSKFGGSSVYFNGSSRLTMPPSPNMDLSVGDFTVEAWVYSTTLTGTGSAATRAAAGNISTAAELQWGIYRSGSSMIVRPYQSTTDFSINIGTIATGTWYHVAITRSGNTIRGFLNGVAAGTTQTISGALNNNTAWYGVLVGGITVSSSSEYWNGYIDDLRITKGVARYTSNFTPPTRALPTR